MLHCNIHRARSRGGHRPFETTRLMPAKSLSISHLAKPCRLFFLLSFSCFSFDFFLISFDIYVFFFGIFRCFSCYFFSFILDAYSSFINRLAKLFILPLQSPSDTAVRLADVSAAFLRTLLHLRSLPW